MCVLQKNVCDIYGSVYYFSNNELHLLPRSLHENLKSYIVVVGSSFTLFCNPVFTCLGLWRIASASCTTHLENVSTAAHSDGCDETVFLFCAGKPLL